MYCTLDDIQKQVIQDSLIQLTDDNQLGVIDTDVIQEAISYSGTLIDGYLRGRYTLPLSTVPEIIKIIAVDLSIYRLYSRRFQTEMPDAIKEKYNHSSKILEQIQRGKILPDIESEEEMCLKREYKCNKTYSDRIFSNEVLKKF